MTLPPHNDQWDQLRKFTQARIALGRVGASLPTQRLLEFGIAHARARDAVNSLFDADAVCEQLHAASFASLRVHSGATDREQYLQRPDLGRRLDEGSRERLIAAARRPGPAVAFVIGDGLSAIAPLRHAVPVLTELRAAMGSAASFLGVPVIVAEQARVALGDEIGELLCAAAVVVLIGERPGLSSPDSLGAYLTFAPRVGRTDADRNCISNIRLDGLPYSVAAARLLYLLTAARRLGYSGVRLKDDSDDPRLTEGA